MSLTWRILRTLPIATLMSLPCIGLAAAGWDCWTRELVEGYVMIPLAIGFIMACIVITWESITN